MQNHKMANDNLIIEAINKSKVGLDMVRNKLGNKGIC